MYILVISEENQLVTIARGSRGDMIKRQNHVLGSIVLKDHS